MLSDLQKQITEKCDIHESYKLLFPPIEDKIISSNSTKSSNNKCECTDLLLDPISMIKENYPFFENEAEIIRGIGLKQLNYRFLTHLFGNLRILFPKLDISIQARTIPKLHLLHHYLLSIAKW